MKQVDNFNAIPDNSFYNNAVVHLKVKEVRYEP